MAEFVCQIPQRVLNRVGEPKRLVRSALTNLAPAHFATSMQKIVPTPLFDRGLRDNGQAVALSLIRDSRAARQGFLDQKQLHDAYQALCERRPAKVAEIWRALSFELWLQRAPG